MQAQTINSNRNNMLHIFLFLFYSYFSPHTPHNNWLNGKKVKKNLQGMTPMDYALHLKHTGLFFFLFLSFLFPSLCLSFVFFSLSNTCSLEFHFYIPKFISVLHSAWTIEVTLAMVLHPTRFVCAKTSDKSIALSFTNDLTCYQGRRTNQYGIEKIPLTHGRIDR